MLGGETVRRLHLSTVLEDLRPRRFIDSVTNKYSVEYFSRPRLARAGARRSDFRVPHVPRTSGTLGPMLSHCVLGGIRTPNLRFRRPAL